MYILIVAKVSNNEVNVCRSNPCEQKADLNARFPMFFSTFEMS